MASQFLEKRDEFLAVEYTTKPWDVMHPNELMRAEHDNRVAGARNDAVDLQEPASVIPTRSEGGEASGPSAGLSHYFQ